MERNHLNSLNNKNRPKVIKRKSNHANDVLIKIPLKPGERYCTLCNSRPIWEGISDVHCKVCYCEVHKKKDRGPAGFKAKDLTYEQIRKRNDDRLFGKRDENFFFDNSKL